MDTVDLTVPDSGDKESPSLRSLCPSGGQPTDSEQDSCDRRQELRHKVKPVVVSGGLPETIREGVAESSWKACWEHPPHPHLGDEGRSLWLIWKLTLERGVLPDNVGTVAGLGLLLRRPHSLPSAPGCLQKG